MKERCIRDMRSWVAVVCLWAAVGVEVGSARSQGLFGRDLLRPDRIVGGEPVEKGKFLWQVSLQNHQRHFCGGTLIAPNWVVTAAHCVENDLRKDMTVVTAAWDLEESSEQRRHRVREIVKGPYNSVTLENDIALLWIEEEEATARRNDLPHGTPMTIETRRDRGAGVKCLISGWGRLSSGGKLTPVLMAADVELRTDKECGAIFARHTFFSVYPSNVCAGGGKKDACQGDSGGPMVCCKGDTMDPSHCTLTGITSWGIGCATEGVPGVYTEVAYYADWIKTQVKKLDRKKSNGLTFYGEKNERE
ncbi:trypsin I-P1-like isoform X2 [Scylla paramamosain]|uniref:trypsin I-P1-like isoform X2 n=1 Tax=Scylla paramamosain TaxID=85552 RepID=UPI003082E747